MALFGRAATLLEQTTVTAGSPVRYTSACWSAVWGLPGAAPQRLPGRLARGGHRDGHLGSAGRNLLARTAKRRTKTNQDSLCLVVTVEDNHNTN